MRFRVRSVFAWGTCVSDIITKKCRSLDARVTRTTQALRTKFSRYSNAWEEELYLAAQPPPSCLTQRYSAPEIRGSIIICSPNLGTCVQTLSYLREPPNLEALSRLFVSCYLQLFGASRMSLFQIPRTDSMISSVRPFHKSEVIGITPSSRKLRYRLTKLPGLL